MSKPGLNLTERLLASLSPQERAITDQRKAALQAGHLPSRAGLIQELTAKVRQQAATIDSLEAEIARLTAELTAARQPCGSDEWEPMQ